MSGLDHSWKIQNTRQLVNEAISSKSIVCMEHNCSYERFLHEAQ